MNGRKPKFIPLGESSPDVGEKVNLRDRSHWSNKDVEKWNAKDFMFYFAHLYERRFGVRYVLSPQIHSGVFSTLRKRNGNERVKLLIDTYFLLEYNMVNVEHFSKTTRQNELTLFLEKGIQPMFTAYAPRNQQQVDSVVQDGRQVNAPTDNLFGGK